MANLVKGSLKKHFNWWSTNIHSEYILDVVHNGYKLPLLEMPVPVLLNNNRSAHVNPDFVGNQIEKLLNTGVIIELKQPPTIVNPLTVAENSVGKKRLVLDMRTVNPLLNVPSFKFEDLKVASTYFTPGCYMCIFDLSSGYHHIDINVAYQQFLGFSWNNKYYTFSVCPFGMASAGLIFSKVLRQLVKKWRAQGISIVLYLDDGLLVSKSIPEMNCWAEIIQNDLKQAGFKINEEKSCWTPSQCVKWLGIILDSNKNIYEVPSDKLGRLKISIFKNLKYKLSCSTRELAKTVGKITSLFHAYGGIVYIMTKDITKWISEGSSWGHREVLPEAVVNELSFWYNNLSLIIRKPLVKDLTRDTNIVFSDASATGCGAFVVGLPKLKMVHYWQEYEMQASSTWRELKTVSIYLTLHEQIFAGQAVTWYTDNQAVPIIAYKGSMKADLNFLALEIHKTCLIKDIELNLFWVPREQNELADELSKVEDTEDWQVQVHIFQFLQKRYKTFTLDPFASNLSAKTEKFFSKYWCRNSSGVDAFSYCWEDEILWLVPPPRLIARVLFHAKLSRGKGLLIVPKWQSAAYWPLLWNGYRWAEGLSLLLEYKKPANFFKRGHFGNNTFCEEQFSSNVLVFELNYTA